MHIVTTMHNVNSTVDGWRILKTSVANFVSTKEPKDVMNAMILKLLQWKKFFFHSHLFYMT